MGGVENEFSLYSFLCGMNLFIGSLTSCEEYLCCLPSDPCKKETTQLCLVVWQGVL